MLVQQILKSKADDGVVTLPPGSTVGQAVELLSTRRIGAVVISPDGKAVAGILSERDVVRELGRRGPAVLNDRVDAIMTAKIVSCGSIWASLVADELTRRQVSSPTDSKCRSGWGFGVKSKAKSSAPVTRSSAICCE